MSGAGSGLPSGKLSRNGETWLITANDPLSYEPAGSMLVILSLVPMVSAPPLLPPEPPLPSPPPQAVRARAVIAMPAPAASARRPPLETDLIRYLVFMGAGRGRTKRSHRGRPWVMEV